MLKPIPMFVMALVLISPYAHAAEFEEQSLGKLFTSVNDREIIDSTRGGTGGTESVVVRREAPSSVNINGLVIRSKGKNSVWINGNKATGNQTVDGIKVRADAVSKKNKKIPILVDGQVVKIMPGQSWSEDTKSVVDNY